MIDQTILACGVRVLTERIPDVRSATIGIWADVGSAIERPARRGVSHLVEHMIFKGTPTRTARAIAEQIDGIGGDLNAFTDKETTCYYARVMDRHVSLAIDTLSDMFLHSLFDPAELEREQSVVLDEIKMYDDSPDEILGDLFARTMWRGSQLGEPTIGYAETVAALRADDLRDHMRRHYAPDAVIVAVAGNVEHHAVVALLEQRFAAFRGRAERVVAETPLLTPAVAVRRKETEQAYVMFGARGLRAAHEDRYALAIADTVLGGGMSSRLFQEIRERRGLAYNVHSFEQTYRAAGLFGVYAGTSPENVQECVDVIVDEVSLLARNGVTAAELALAKEHLKGSLTLSLESTSARMMRLARNELVFGRQITTEEVETAIDGTTLDDVARVAQTLLAPESFGLCVLGPFDESDIRFEPRSAAA